MNCATTADKFAALEARIAELERLVSMLARERDARQPFGPIPSSPKIYPQYPFIPVVPSVGAKPRCVKCNIEFSDVMGYVCSYGGNCPTGLGGVSCASTS